MDASTERDVALNVRIPEPLRAMLKVEAARRRVTMSALVVEGLTRVVRPTLGDREKEDHRCITSR